MIRNWTAGAMLALVASVACAEASPVGLWKSIDDKTKEERSLVRISDSGGVLSGVVEKILDPAKANAVCESCPDARKDKPIVGMTILNDVRKAATEPYWEGGQILDPANGKTYKVRLTPQEDGKRLEVRGFIGPFYRNQYWVRVQ